MLYDNSGKHDRTRDDLPTRSVSLSATSVTVLYPHLRRCSGSQNTARTLTAHFTIAGMSNSSFRLCTGLCGFQALARRTWSTKPGCAARDVFRKYTCARVFKQIMDGRIFIHLLIPPPPSDHYVYTNTPTRISGRLRPKLTSACPHRTQWERPRHLWIRP